MESTNIRLVAIDLDGTLLDSESNVPDWIHSSIEGLREKGVHLVAATGRRLSSAKPHLDRLGWDGWAVVNNGATVVESPNGPTRWSRYVPADFARHSVERILQHDLGPIVYFDEGSGPGEVIVQAGCVDSLGYIARYTQAIQGFFTVVEGIERRSFGRVIRVACAGELEKLKDLASQLGEDTSHHARCLLVHDPIFDVARLEIIHSDVSKWAGLQVVADALSIAPSEISAIGDDTNDIEMISAAGIGIAVANAHPRTKDAADWVTKEPGPRGVLEALNKLFPGESFSK